MEKGLAFFINERFRISPGLFFDAIFVLSNILFMSEKEKWRKLNMAEKESAIYTAYEKIEKIKKMMQCGPFVLDCDTVLSGIMNESIKNHLLERTGVSGEIFDIYENSVDQKSVSGLFEVLTGRGFDGYLSECIKAIEKKGETDNE